MGKSIPSYPGDPHVCWVPVRTPVVRQGLSPEFGRGLFWKLLEVMQMVYQVFSTYCKVKYCVENVASMDEEARMAISDELGICPIKFFSADQLPNSRPRFAWCSEEVF